MNRFYRILRGILLVVSAGFYTLPVVGAECPGHPKGPTEMHEEEKRKERQRDPGRALEDEEQRKENDKSDNGGRWG